MVTDDDTLLNVPQLLRVLDSHDDKKACPAGLYATEPLDKSGYACWAALQSINRRNTRYTTLRVFGAARQSAETGTVGPVLRPPCEARAWMEWHVPLQAVYLGERYGWSHTEDHEGLGY